MFAPGISLNRLLKEAPDVKIKDLFEPELIKSLELIDSNLLTGDSLRKITKQLIQPFEVLQDIDKRAILLGLLSFEKRAELARRIGTREDASLKDIIESTNEASVSLL